MKPVDKEILGKATKERSWGRTKVQLKGIIKYKWYWQGRKLK